MKMPILGFFVFPTGSSLLIGIPKDITTRKRLNTRFGRPDHHWFRM